MFIVTDCVEIVSKGDQMNNCEEKGHSTSFFRWSLAFYYGFYVCSHCGKQVKIPCKIIKKCRYVLASSTLIPFIFSSLALDFDRPIIMYLGCFLFAIVNFLYLYVQWKKECKRTHRSRQWCLRRQRYLLCQPLQRESTDLAAEEGVSSVCDVLSLRHGRRASPSETALTDHTKPADIVYADGFVLFLQQLTNSVRRCHFVWSLGHYCFMGTLLSWGVLWFVSAGGGGSSLSSSSFQGRLRVTWNPCLPWKGRCPRRDRGVNPGPGGFPRRSTHYKWSL